MTSKEKIREKLALLPDAPGVYIMRGGDNRVIYVGKAKVLKNRVRSYFTGSHDGKTQLLVSEITDFEYIVTNSATEALILESNLIKQYRPRFNVLLKDDKSYPYIMITSEEHPRLIVTRQADPKKGKVFGPYPNAGAAQQTKRLMDKLYPLRKCSPLKDRVCLYYHIGQCLAPCEFSVDTAQYEPMIAEMTRFLQGGYQEVRETLQRKMAEAAENLDFERAQELRDQIIQMDTTMVKQKITLNDNVDRDVFAYAVKDGWMCIQVFYMRQGKLIERDVSAFPYYGDETEDFTSFVTQYYTEHRALPKEVFLPPDVETDLLQEWLGIRVVIPKRGLKRKLVEMAEENARIALDERFRLMAREAERTVHAVEELGAFMGIGTPRHIEVFDNSNIQGKDPVSAMVVFRDGKPDKKAYRKFKIREISGPDDYETMRQVIRRRYTRLLKENGKLPDLVMVDGGKGQISAAVDVLENELGLSIPVCGLVKDERHRTSELYLGDPAARVPIDRNSQAFYLLYRMQEEVHRFAVAFHRQTRTKSMLQSRLDEIPGIGEARRKKLLKHFGSLKAIQSADINQFREIGIGDKLARQILAHLNGTAVIDSSGEL
jgi:excinuclease ABC subunit C